jgi:hypothetical protein
MGANTWFPRQITRPEFVANGYMTPYVSEPMSTAREIEDAIRALAKPERDKLLGSIPKLFPELGDDAEWDRIIGDHRPRVELTNLLNETEAEFRRARDKFPELTDDDLSL